MSDVNVHVDQQQPINVEIIVANGHANIGGSTDNSPRNIYLTIEAPMTAAKALAAVNNAPTFTQAANEVIHFIASDFTTQRGAAYRFRILELGAGTYGIGGTSIVGANRVDFMGVPTTPTVEDIANLPNTQTLTWGDVANPSDYLNSQNPAIELIDPSIGAVLIITDGGSYIFEGGGGFWGFGQQQSTLAMFKPINEMPVIPGETNLSYDANTREISNDNGTGFTIPIVNETDPGLVTPADLAAWYGKQNALGFTPENVANKDAIPTNETSATKYPSVKAVVDYLVQGWNAVIPAKTTEIHDTDAVIFFNNTDSGKTKTRTWSQLKTTLLSVFQKKDNQIPIGANTTISDTWDGQTIIFTASCTITVPATLPAGFGFNFIVKIGVTVTWAITAPHTWGWGTPTPTVEKTYGNFTKEGSTNNIILGT